MRISLVCLLTAASLASVTSAADPPALRIDWKDNYLTVSGEHIPGGPIRIHYLEAYCRAGSTDRDWGKTVVGHRTELISKSDDGQSIDLRCTLKDGVTVDHKIRVEAGAVDFRLTAHNPTKKASEADWAQPCVRVDKFTGGTQESYVEKCFLFLDDKLARMPTPHWATKARYIPGQVWAAPRVNRNDVNPRPLSDDIPSNGLIGCFSADETMLLASAWEPYQELFQGVAVCVHSDFRIGGLEPGETKEIRGKLYLMPADVEELLARYRKDFPEHAKAVKTR